MRIGLIDVDGHNFPMTVYDVDEAVEQLEQLEQTARDCKGGWE